MTSGAHHHPASASRPSSQGKPPRRRHAEVAGPPCEETNSPSQRRARSLLGVFFVLLGLYTLQSVLPALLWGCVFAIACWPLYRHAVQKWGDSNWIPALFTIIVALIFLAPMSYLAIKTAEEAQGALHWLDTVRHEGVPAPPWLSDLPFLQNPVTSAWQKYLSDPQQLNQIFLSLDTGGHRVAVTKQVTSLILRRSTLFLFSILTLFFLLRDGASIISRLITVSERTFGQRGEVIARQIIYSVNGTIAGLVFVGLGEGFVMGAVYAFAGTPQPILFSFLTGVAAMIPFLALPTVMVAALLVLVQGKVVAACLIIAIGCLVIFVADHFIRPVIIGGTIRMPFLWVLLGILGGVETWGLLGLFLGPAIMAALHKLWRIWSDTETIGIHSRKRQNIV